MKKIQFVCDRCGAVLGKTAIKIIPNVVGLDGEDILHPVDEATQGMHFCAACTDAFLKFLLPENKPPPKQKEKPARRRRLDAGRVMALHNAGWSNEDIAADIRAEPEQVRQCIYYRKHKKKIPLGADGEKTGPGGQLQGGASGEGVYSMKVRKETKTSLTSDYDTDKEE